jgi:hypothetical protein
MAACPPPEKLRAGRLEGSPAGTSLIPSDHQRLISAYGVGCFDDFLWIYGEGGGNPLLDISARTESARKALGAYSRGEFGDFLSSLDISTGDLIRWGGTDNGDMLLWAPVGEEWPTLIVAQRPLEYLLLPVSSTRLIHDLLKRRLVTSIFPADFPSGRAIFSSGETAVDG